MFHAIFSVALLAIFFGVRTVSSSICPPADQIAPCKCADYFKSIECEKVELGADLQKIFLRLSAEIERRNARPVYDQFKLANSALTEIGAGDVDILAGISFRRISIEKNRKLRRLHPNAFRSSFNTTTELFFEDNELLGATDEDSVALFQTINFFTSLQTLHITDIGIRSIPKEAFRLPQPALGKIFLTDNRIESIGDNAFTGLDGLEQINLDGNQISRLSLRSLEMPANPQHSDKLLKIFLRSNRLSSTSFPPGIFSYLRRRAYLNLNLNNLTSVPQAVFQSLSLRRSVLSLYKNPLRCDCAFKWLLDQSLLYNSSNPTAEYFLREYTCSSDKDEETLISEADTADFEHCPDTAFAEPNRECIEQALDPESEHACLNGSTRHTLSHLLVVNVLAYLLFSLLRP